jgi:beta-glucosidase
LFPFGHGLSYTSFEYSDLTVSQSQDNNGLEARFTVRNTGTRAGTEVAQVYVGPPDLAPQPMAPQVLAGFQRIKLNEGNSRDVTIRVEPRQLSYWSTPKHDWVLATGYRPVYVGSSSRDIKLTETVLIRALPS